jgi:hypothetical protein
MGNTIILMFLLLTVSTGIVKAEETIGAHAYAYGGGGSNESTSEITGFNFVDFGRYHRAYLSNGIWRVPSETTIEWWSPDYPYVWGDEYNPSHYASNMGEKFEDSQGEMVTCIFRIDTITSGGTVSVEYRKSSDNSLVFKYECDVVSPSSCGYGSWLWAYWYTWIGKGFEHSGCSQSSPCVYERSYSNPCQYGFSKDRVYFYEDEIDSIGDYYVVIKSPWTSTRTVNFNIAEPVTAKAYISIKDVIPYAAAGAGIVLLAIAFRRF